MIIVYEQLKKKPNVFKGFTGVTVAEFEALAEKVEPMGSSGGLLSLTLPPPPAILQQLYCTNLESGCESVCWIA